MARAPIPSLRALGLPEFECAKCIGCFQLKIFEITVRNSPPDIIQEDTLKQTFPGRRSLVAWFSRNRSLGCALLAVGIFCPPINLLQAADMPRRTPLSLKPDDVLPTGNEWVALPAISAADGSLASFNVLSMRDRGLLEVTGERGKPVLQPYFTVKGKPLPFRNPSWELVESARKETRI